MVTCITSFSPLRIWETYRLARIPIILICAAIILYWLWTIKTPAVIPEPPEREGVIPKDKHDFLGKLMEAHGALRLHGRNKVKYRMPNGESDQLYHFIETIAQRWAQATGKEQRIFQQYINQCSRELMGPESLYVEDQLLILKYKHLCTSPSEAELFQIILSKSEYGEIRKQIIDSACTFLASWSAIDSAHQRGRAMLHLISNLYTVGRVKNTRKIDGQNTFGDKVKQIMTTYRESWKSISQEENPQEYDMINFEKPIIERIQTHHGIPAIPPLTMSEAQEPNQKDRESLFEYMENTARNWEAASLQERLILITYFDQQLEEIKALQGNEEPLITTETRNRLYFTCLYSHLYPRQAELLVTFSMKIQEDEPVFMQVWFEQAAACVKNFEKEVGIKDLCLSLLEKGYKWQKDGKHFIEQTESLKLFKKRAQEIVLHYEGLKPSIKEGERLETIKRQINDESLPLD